MKIENSAVGAYAPAHIHTSGRKTGIDLLRMLSMFMVVLLHVVGVAGMLDAASGEPVKYAQLKLLQIAAICAVNCYGLISGYVGWKSKFCFSSIASLWLQVFLYSAGLGVLFYVFLPGAVPIKDVINLFLPVLMQRYWYFTAYFALFFTMPLLNAAITHLPRRQLKYALICLLFLLTVCQQTVIVTNAFGTNDGYSYVWLAVLYCVGGYLGKYGVRMKRPGAMVGIYGAGLVLCWAAQYLMRGLGIGSENRLEAYNSPVMLLMAVALLLFFAHIRLPGWLEKTVKVLAPASFGVYLIHLHPLVRNFLLLDRFKSLADCPAWAMIPLVLGLTLGIYLACSGIDLLRHWLFRALKVKQRLAKLENKLLPEQDGA